LGHGLLFTQGGVGASPGYDCIDLRRALSPGLQEGYVDSGAYAVTQRGAGANLSVDIAAGTGAALVQGDSVTAQGLYTIPPHGSATINEAITAAHATLPRIDQVVLEALDDTHAGGGSNKSRTRVIDGTATAGATLVNRTGAAALPSSCKRLADVVVPALDTTITNDQIADRRTDALGGAYAPYRTLRSVWAPTTADMASGTYLLTPSGCVASGGTVTSQFPGVWLDSSDYTVSGRNTRLRVRGVVAPNATTPALIFSFGLYPVTAAGGADSFTVTLGARVTDSSAVLGNNAAPDAGASLGFAVPTTGLYALGFSTAAQLTNNNFSHLLAELQLHWI
jgi:hypothetical protein